jgi:ribonuclease HIII
LESKESLALKILSGYRNLMESHGFSVSAPVKQNYAYISEVCENKDSVILLVYFGKKGTKTVLQGNKESVLYKKINDLIFGEKLFNESQLEFNDKEYIGTDESGKGDFFGPLVVAGVYVDSAICSQLAKLGVRDSKALSDNQILKMAMEIKESVKQRASIIAITPKKYNQLHKKMGSVNRILGWAHARVLENILNSFDVKYAISDKFGNEKLILDALQEKGRNLNLYQTTKAERFIGVAAASVLAREVVLRWFEYESRRLGMQIPKGASEEVEKAAKIILEKSGEELFNSLVKIHFKTSKKIINDLLEN